MSSSSSLKDKGMKISHRRRKQQSNSNNNSKNNNKKKLQKAQVEIENNSDNHHDELEEKENEEKANSILIEDLQRQHERIKKSAFVFCLLWALLCSGLLTYWERHKLTFNWKELFQSDENRASDFVRINKPTTSSLATTIINNQVVTYRTYLGPEKHPNPNIRNLPSDLSDWIPGEMGLGIQLEKLPKSEDKRRKKMYNTHAFEEYISEMISVERSLPDWRSKWCNDTYPYNKGL